MGLAILLIDAAKLLKIFDIHKFFFVFAQKCTFLIFFLQTVGLWHFEAVILRQIYTDKLRICQSEHADYVF